MAEEGSRFGEKVVAVRGKKHRDGQMKLWHYGREKSSPFVCSG